MATVYTGGSPNFNEQTGQYENPLKSTVVNRLQPQQPTYSTMPVSKSYQPQRPNTQYLGGSPNFNEKTGAYPNQPKPNLAGMQQTYRSQPQQQNPYQNATNRAQSILNPQYANSLRTALDNVKNQSMGSGFYGQLPQVQYSADVAGQVESEKQGAIAQLADSMYNNDRQFGLQESNLTGSYNGAPTMAAQQMALQKAFEEAQLTGLYGGNETLAARQNREQLALQNSQQSGYMPNGDQTLSRELGMSGAQSEWFNNWLKGNQSFYNPGTQQTISQLPPALQPIAQELINYAQPQSVQVGSNGKAPAGLSVGTVVKTGGGDYKITTVKPDGTYESVRVGGSSSGSSSTPTWGTKTPGFS